MIESFFAPKRRACVLLLLWLPAAACTSTPEAPADRHTDAYDFRIDIEGAQPGERRFVETIEAEPWHTYTPEVGGPLIVFGDHAGTAYAIDLSRQLILKSDREAGTLEIGGGKGQGPGEFRGLSGLALAPGGSLFAMDGNLRRVSVFSAAGAFERSFKTEALGHHLALRADGALVTMSAFSGAPALFHRYEVPSGAAEVAAEALAPTLAFGTLISDQAAQAMVLDGDIATVSNDLVYVPRYFNFIARFDAEGRLVYARPTIDAPNAAAPRVEGAGGGFSLVGRDAPLHGALSASQGRLYVAASRPSREAGTAVVDVYDAGDGAYLHSIRLPLLIWPVHVAYPFVYGAAQGTSIHVLRLRQADTAGAE